MPNHRAQSGKSGGTPCFIDTTHDARVSSRRCGPWVGSRISFLALPRDTEDTQFIFVMGKGRTSLEAIEMFSDNENPGADISAGQTAAAATPAPEQETTVEVEAAFPVAVQVESATVTAPSMIASEPAAVTVAPAEPIAEPDGPAAIEHSTMTEALESDEASTESTAEMEKLMEQY